VFLVRKLGMPGQGELAMGAVPSGGARVLDLEAVRLYGVSEEELNRVTASARRELDRREKAYRGSRPPVDVRGKTVILVDDGLATGSSMRAALAALGPLAPARVVVAVPVAPRSTVRELEPLADAVVCVATPEPFYAVGMFYKDFEQTSDDEVRNLLTSPIASGTPSRRSRSSMPNRLVPRTEWSRFFRGFTRRHEGWRVNVRIVCPSLGSQVESIGLPLEGIVADAGGHAPISILMGRVPGRNVEHEVPDPRQVWVKLSPAGAEESLEIESEDGTQTILEFLSTREPREVNGRIRP
jgi:predicted phosphoribosyltransferase